MNIQTVTYDGLSFLNVHKPQELEIKFLRKTYGFNPLNLEDYVNKTQIPKIEVYKEYTLVVLDFPYINQNGPVPAKTQATVSGKKSLPLPQIPLPHFPAASKKKRILVADVDFFIGHDYLVILHENTTPQIDEVFALCQQTIRHRQDLMGEGSVFLFYRLVDILVDSSFTLLDELSSTIDTIDKKLSETRSPDIVEDISVTRRNIVVFQTMIKPALPIFADLEKGKYEKLNMNMSTFWSNILDHLQKISDRLEDNRELIEGISVSNESLLTSRTNETIKVLTMFSAIILPLTLLASVYGMNIIGLPFANHPGALLIIALVMLILAFGMVFVFKYKNWL